MTKTPPSEELLGLLRQMDPHEFEKLVAELWRQLGYSATVRQRSRDRGIDVIATRESPVKEKHVIQAKRYAEDNKIGSQEVRNYATLYQQVTDADKVILVTTSELTTEARRLAKDLNVQFMSGEELCDKIRESGTDVEKYLPIGENQPSQTTSTQSLSDQSDSKKEEASSGS
ncbi:restriction endonuclease, partial [Halorussus sp. MSC15.2]|uniref:restriction endonuclease n=1 Tax=Halorussus sp. MSC15.2 TaxID=2283638 RepID=UPI0013D1275D